MSREFLAIYPAMMTKPKYRRLSPIGRGALLHVFMLAGYQSPEATWRDPDELRESLVLEQFPAGSLDELIGLGWLEYDEAGRRSSTTGTSGSSRPAGRSSSSTRRIASAPGAARRSAATQPLPPHP